MIDYKLCDCCQESRDTMELVWISADDFKPTPKDDWNPVKHQEAIEIHNFDALCESCYHAECCGDNSKEV